MSMVVFISRFQNRIYSINFIHLGLSGHIFFSVESIVETPLWRRATELTWGKFKAYCKLQREHILFYKIKIIHKKALYK